jgi:hypothetical protein
MLRTYLVCRGKQERERERERETNKPYVVEAHSVLITAILLPQRLSCYWGKIVSLRMLANLRVAVLRLTTAQQRFTGQNLPSDLYCCRAALPYTIMVPYWMIIQPRDLTIYHCLVPWHSYVCLFAIYFILFQFEWLLSWFTWWRRPHAVYFEAVFG